MHPSLRPHLHRVQAAHPFPGLVEAGRFYVWLYWRLYAVGEYFPVENSSELIWVGSDDNKDAAIRRFYWRNHHPSRALYGEILVAKFLHINNSIRGWEVVRKEDKTFYGSIVELLSNDSIRSIMPYLSNAFYRSRSLGINLTIEPRTKAFLALAILQGCWL